MKRKTLITTLAFILTTGSGATIACEYKAGVTLFLDYANCRYGEDNVLVIDLPEDSGWEKCIYYLQAFTPEKLLAVTRQKDGKEMLSVNNRKQIGNPCYLSKQKCDRALRAYQQQ